MRKPAEGDRVRCIIYGGGLEYNKNYTVASYNDTTQQVCLKEVNNAWSIERFLLLECDAVTASKNDKDKMDLSLIPAVSMREHAKAFMVGEKKYGRYNYAKGHKASQLVAAAMRHLTAWFEREEHDAVDGQHHLGSVMACCSMILRQQELGTLKDDRYENNSK